MNFNRFFLAVLLLLPFLYSAYANDNGPQRNDGKFVVVLDAGHGGHDPGNLGNGYLEKDIALKIVLNVGRILESNPDIRVIYTRKDDTFVDLFVRGEIANKANADLFVSVHCDSHSSDAHGAGTFVLGLHANKQNFEIAKKENSVIYLEDNYADRYADYDINSPESIIGLTIMQEEFLDQSIALAKMIQDNFTGKLKRVNRKVKQAGFIVLHQTFMPSVLVETGFLTNKSEGAYLNSKKGQAEVGKAIADAILIYKKNVHTGIGYVPNKEIEKELAPKEEASIPVKKEKPVNELAAAPKKEEQPKTQPVLEAAEKSTPVADKGTMAQEVSGEKESTVTEVVTAVKKQETPQISFKVQIMASAKDIELVPQNFKGLARVTREPYKNLFRYMYGNANSFTEAKMLKSNADIKGFSGSYIVAYKDGVRIPVTEALKYVSE
ncbi:N-acetylmuramoyl-L-alanine amidase [Maribacter polysiphoniae]|uniref:N-acetylmuramoyl-L-alanine amidase n=1 Tax=Maribacter polysiphoniae TaxID=429344 RepID=A0A316DUD2_9FLAO|nr:N-acetylmuramoyl-L-alanine amidase [Maribacter polysiphoniae]MBD1262784.1 N-acetylmuramoyl-L-alanine amidase [Maribacter polysiphoniae]PWK21927.1 N-acetylmuramoyl-L-alanine amidase [Maribacter polysiphoniae]